LKAIAKRNSTDDGKWAIDLRLEAGAAAREAVEATRRRQLRSELAGGGIDGRPASPSRSSVGRSARIAKGLDVASADATADLHGASRACAVIYVSRRCWRRLGPVRRIRPFAHLAWAHFVRSSGDIERSKGLQ